MLKNKITTLIVVGALALVGTIGAFTYGTVKAQTPTPATPTTPQTTPDQPGFGRGFRGGMEGATGEQDLATALGITVEKLQAAYQSANTEALKEAVSKGLITQAQADEMATRSANHPMGGFGHFGSDPIDYNALLANALGITTDQLQTARQQVFTTNLDNAVKNGQLTQEQADQMKAENALANNSTFQTSMQSAFSAALKQAVSDGILTQAQADTILKNSAGMNFIGRGGKGGFDGMPGHGGRGGFENGKGAKSMAPSTTAPNATPSDGL